MNRTTRQDDDREWSWLETALFTLPVAAIPAVIGHVLGVAAADAYSESGWRLSAITDLWDFVRLCAFVVAPLTFIEAALVRLLCAFERTALAAFAFVVAAAQSFATTLYVYAAMDSV